MQLPYVVVPNISAEQVRIWRRVYAPTRGTTTDKTIEESLWRRTQMPTNREHSGWRSEADRRRKLLHYRHHYDVVANSQGGHDLVLADSYIWLNIAAPGEEISQYAIRIRAALATGGWRRRSSYSHSVTYQRGSLLCTLSWFDEHPQDTLAGRTFPSYYQVYEVALHSTTYPSGSEQAKPWRILQTPARQKLERGQPRLLDRAADLADFLPAQIELGCGPSIEAGVPPLHYLHQLYALNDPITKRFMITPAEETLLPSLLADVDGGYNQLTSFFASIIQAQPTRFHQIMRRLYDANMIVGPLITNNFDGLHSRLGIPEIFIRRYDDMQICLQVAFDRRARSLLVIGSHADRRGIRAAARAKGLPVIYIDPECYVDHGVYVSYPLEAPQTEDYVYRDGAVASFVGLEQALIERGLLSVSRPIQIPETERVPVLQPAQFSI